MPVHSYTWIITIAVMLGLLILDVLLMKRHPHKPSVKECSIWVSVYIGLALIFGMGVWMLAGRSWGRQFYAVWITEYSLSLDNLFIFIILMSKLKVPEKLQQLSLIHI